MIEDAKITDVVRDDTGYCITCAQICFTLHDKNNKTKVVPKVGDKIKLCIVNGSTVRGVDINGKQVFYKSDKQLKEEHREWCEKYDKERKEKFEKNKEFLDASFSGLPQEFKNRILRFRRKDSDFRWKDEGYEMFCCTEAVKLANALKTPETVEAFSKKDWTIQKAEVPGISEEHSGNTFGGTCRLAYAYLKGLLI